MILLALALAWLSGLGLAAAGLSEAYLLAPPLGIGAAIGFAVSRRIRLATLTFAGALLFVLAILRFEAALPPEAPQGIALHNDGEAVRIRGLIDEEPEERRQSQRFVVKVEEVFEAGAWQQGSGRLQVTTRLFPKFEYGDRLELEAELETPPTFESFDYREYLARRGVISLAAYPDVQRIESDAGAWHKTLIIDLRDRLGDSLSQALPEPEAALARGMLLGQRSSIPAELNDDFNRAGISHLIAISGSNVALIAALAQMMFAPLVGRRCAVVAAMLLIAAFVVLVGASPSVVRAGVMGWLMLGAILVGRPRSALTAVAFAAVALTALQPLAAIDVAFQLSFAATLGLILVAPSLSRIVNAGLAPVLPATVAAPVASVISLTTAASLAVFPVTAANFERVSLIAIPANVVAAPLFGLVIVNSFVSSLAGLLSEDLANIVALFAEVPLSLLIETARFFSALPYASVGIEGIGLLTALVIYGCVALLTLALSRARPVEESVERVRFGVALPAAALAILVAALLWVDVLLTDERLLRVSVLDVGQGDAILITTPEGQRILVDGGPSGSAVLNALGAELPSRAQDIDLVVLTHPQEDHVAGLVAVTERYEVGLAATSGVTSESASYLAWRQELNQGDVPLRDIVAGETADLGGGVHLEVLAPPSSPLSGTADDVNNASIVLRLTYGDVSFLLTGDLAEEGEEWLLSNRGRLQATVLKVGHHGSDGSSTDAFLSAVKPAVAVISAGDDNPFGHPSPTTLLRLARIPFFRTDRNGTVRFETDGQRLYVEPERGSYQLVPVSAR